MQKVIGVALKHGSQQNHSQRVCAVFVDDDGQSSCATKKGQTEAVKADRQTGDGLQCHSVWQIFNMLKGPPPQMKWDNPSCCG